MNQFSALKRLAMICVMAIACIGRTAISQDTDQLDPDVEKQIIRNRAAIVEVFKGMVNYGYSRADQFVAARIEEFESVKRGQLNELKTELVNTDQADTGKGTLFKNAREKAIRKEELRLRIAKLESSQPNPVTVKWLPVEQDFNPVELTSAIRPGGIYSIGSLEVSQVTGADLFHGYVRILPPNPKPAAEVAWRNPKSDSAKRWLQLQRCAVYYPDGTVSLKYGDEMIQERSLYICVDMLTYESDSGTKAIPLMKSLAEDWKIYLKANVPEASMKIITPKPVPPAPLASREWKDTTGKFSVEATLVSSNELNVELKKKDGTKVSVRKSTLCLQDNMHIAAASIAELPYVSRWKKPDDADY